MARVWQSLTRLAREEWFGYSSGMSSNPRRKALLTFVQTALAATEDRYQATPLRADAIEVRTGEPLVWLAPEGDSIPSNFACQQNFQRVLDGLTALTGDSSYRQAAEATAEHMFRNYQTEAGLLRWGGHQYIDLKTGDLRGYPPPAVHELKNGFPFYDLMHRVDPVATDRLIRSIWSAHVYDWATLETGRHGDYEQPVSADLWHRRPFSPPPPFFETKGLSFLNAGNDLIYAAAEFARLSSTPSAETDAALLWTSRLVDQYVAARHPETGLGAYQFSQPRKTAEPPNDETTLSWYGDRAQRQLGPEWDPNPHADPTRRKVLEATVLLQHQALSIYSENALLLLQLGVDLGEAGRRFLDVTLSGLKAYVRHAYDESTNTMRPLLTDGRDLSGFVLQRDGYFGSKGTVLEPFTATPFLSSLARAWRVSGDEAFWKPIRGIARAIGLGNLEGSTACDDPVVLFALLDLHVASGRDSYLDLARQVGDNLVAKRFFSVSGGRSGGWFLSHPSRRYARIDAIEPYALLALEAALAGRSDVVAPFLNGSGFMDVPYRRVDGSHDRLKDKVLHQLNHGDPGF